MKRVAEVALSKKQNEGLIFENRAGVTVNDILPDDDANKEFKTIDGNFAGGDWEAEPMEQEIQETAFHILHINNNQHVELAENEDDEKNEDNQENDTESTGVENDMRKKIIATQ